MILGDYIDVWGFGAVNPSSGTVQMMELNLVAFILLFVRFILDIRCNLQRFFYPGNDIYLSSTCKGSMMRQVKFQDNVPSIIDL